RTGWGDIGTSAPDQWLPWLRDPGPHLLFSLFAQSGDALESVTKQLEQAWHPGCIEVGRCDGAWLPGNIAHFGYRDGLSQPTIEDVPLAGLPDSLPRAKLGDFLLGSHVRRMHPRGQRVVGDGGHLHRIVRRGIPYGPPFDPAHPHDGQARGLLGLFIGVSMRDQFEFLMAEWANDGRFTAGLGSTKDPLLGDNADGSGRFSIPRPEGTLVLEGFSRFITTLGGAYCFLPSMSGIRYLADLAPSS
ncbi:MAG: hypothetical protein ACRDRT_17065, partial [Pseudonocardiaceae bacterium]